MQIHDKHGNSHQLVFGADVWLDRHVVTRTLRTHNTLIMHGFTIPHELRRRSVGSVVLHALERHYGALGVTHFQVSIHGCSDEAHRLFFTKAGYTIANGKFEKFLPRH